MENFIFCAVNGFNLIQERWKTKIKLEYFSKLTCSDDNIKALKWKLVSSKTFKLSHHLPLENASLYETATASMF